MTVLGTSGPFTAACRRATAALALVCVALPLGYSANGAFAESAYPSPQATPPALLMQRVLAQQGLGMGLALFVRTSQVGLATVTVIGDIGKCNPYKGYSSKLISRKVVGKVVTGHARLFFDPACAKVAVDQQITIDLTSETNIPLRGTATVFSKAGIKQGVLALNDKMYAISPSLTGLAGVGTFTPVSGPKVSMGLACRIPQSGTTETCVGGIAQDFPKLGKAIASLTPMTLHFTTVGANTKVTFSQTSAPRLVTGPLTKLKIALTAGNTLIISGPAVQYGTDTVSGSSPDFIPYPPKPTVWSVAAAGRGQFNISLANAAVHSYTGAIKQLPGGAPLATIAVDQSGSGVITYSDHSKAKISHWTLAN